jgi:hypothetical protein
VEGRCFTVHKILVSKISAPLAAMMEGGMREAQEGAATLKDVEVATFARFAEFAYTGNYNIEDCEGAHQPVKEISTKRRKTTHSKDGKTMVPLPTSSSVLSGLRGEDYIGSLMVHAQLYVFADCYAVFGLQDICRWQLNNTLTRFNFAAGDDCDITPFIRYIWEHISESTKYGGSLRRKVMEWIVNNIQELNKHRGFTCLLAEGGEFAMAVVLALGQELASDDESD